MSCLRELAGYQALHPLLRSNALALLTTIAGSAALYFILLFTASQRKEISLPLK